MRRRGVYCGALITLTCAMLGWTATARRQRPEPVSAPPRQAFTAPNPASKSATSHHTEATRPSSRPVNPPTDAPHPAAASSAQVDSPPPPTARTTSTTTTRPAQVRRPPAPATGFNLAGRHYPIRPFAGIGRVPGDGYVYEWTALPGHYLIEYTGAAHAALAFVERGSAITVDGHTYHVTKILDRVPNDEAAIDTLTTARAALGGISFQTCVPQGDSRESPLTLYFAQ
ncbi:hypothetical protein [Lacticaseibacillus absianus]|uniref:hypothetical protein n=1 Tax=Lacticaseibacillus absianus TaxID=2729623 RepID=UPI0015C9F8CE|nr:hypothetical protein [Lacticaseibacillus absianus]